MQDKIKNGIWYILLILFILCCLNFYCYNSVYELDSSWMWALNNISLTGDYIFGRDVFFTYGPFGFVRCPGIEAGSVMAALLYNIFLCAGYIFSFFCFKEKKNFLFFLFGLVVLFFFNAQTPEFLAILLALAFLFSENKKKTAAISLLGVYSAFFLFCKFNIGITFICTFLASILVELKDYKKCLIGLFAFGATVLGVVVFYFKGFDVFWNWFLVAFDIASGFSFAMSRSVMKNFLINIHTPLAVILTSVVYFLTAGCFKKLPPEKIIKTLVVLLPSMFFIYKAGFVRADMHLVAVVRGLLFLSLLMFFIIKDEIFKKYALVWLLLIFAPVHSVFRDPLSGPTFLKQNFKEFQTQNGELPESFIQKAQSKKTEILPVNFAPFVKNQGKFIVHYNPILQLYSVYTKNLDDISAKNYEDKKTDFIIVHDFYAIDERNMLLDTPKTWDKIKENYFVSEFSDGKLLLQKRKREKRTPVEYRTFKKSVYSFKEEIPVPTGAKKAVVKMKLSPLGKVTKLFYKIPPVYIRFYWDEGNKRPGTKRYRFIPETAQNGLYIESHIKNMDAFKDWLNDENKVNKTTALSFSAKKPKLFEKTFEIEWQK